MLHGWDLLISVLAAVLVGAAALITAVATLVATLKNGRNVAAMRKESNGNISLLIKSVTHEAFGRGYVQGLVDGKRDATSDGTSASGDK